jgi:hypothetical protein
MCYLGLGMANYNFGIFTQGRKYGNSAEEHESERARLKSELAKLMSE